jgi:signal peptidase I
MTSREAAVAEGAQDSKELEIVKAADEGAGAYFRAAGYGKLLGFVLASAAIAVFAQHRLRHLDFLLGSLAVFLAVFVLSRVNSATPWGVRSRARSEARTLRRTAAKLLVKNQNRAKIGEPAALEVDKAVAAVDAALAQKGVALPAAQARVALDAVLEKHLSFARKSLAREYTESIGGAILIALLLRAFVFEPFHIPSGSMIPTLLVGDFIFVNKMSYGLRVPFTDPAKVHKLGESAPARGDVIVFASPKTPEVDLVKRVVGLPGDRIDVKDNVVYINGKPQPRVDAGDFIYTERSDYSDSESEVVTRQYIEDLGGVKHPILVRKDQAFNRTWGPFFVPEGRIFVMGDNRDNSSDSRVEGGIGEIPFSYIKGRASLIWISFGGSAGIRFNRLFRSVR